MNQLDSSVPSVDGFRFACQPGCTQCCRLAGYVYLTEDDLRVVAAFLGLSRRAFETQYIYRTKHLLRLRKPRHSQCHFLGEDGCAIHPAKPTQCRVFPFWPELVRSPAAWRRAGKHCPGIGKGSIVPFGGALRLANGMRERYPGIYGFQILSH